MARRTVRPVGPGEVRRMFDLTGRTILVTGGSRGIGRAIALELGAAGARVGVHYRERRESAEEVVARLHDRGVEAKAFAADVTEPDQVVRLLDAVGAWSGRLEGLVTSAGIYRGPTVDEVDAEEWQKVIRTDLEGSFWTVRSALPWLRKGDRPAVVTLSSILGAHAAIGGAPYQMAKAAIEQMTRALSLELAPEIRVNSVAPGFVRTDINRAGHEDPVFSAKVARATPLGRWGEPEDITPAVRFLLSREADWVTGLVLGIDGGLPLR